MTTLESLQTLTDEQLIEKVAVEVMWWSKERYGVCNCHTGWNQGGGSWIGVGHWDPLRNWNDTMEVVERVMTLQCKNCDHWDFNLYLDGPFVNVTFGTDQDDCTRVARENEFSPRRAICVAAILAVQDAK